MKTFMGTVTLVLLAGCGGETPVGISPFTIGPTSSPSQALLGAGTGPTRISFVSADPPPGTAVSGCGRDATGCAGRVRMVLGLRPVATGTALRLVVALYAGSKGACFLASTGPLPLSAFTDTSVQVVLDPSEGCTTPFAITDLSATLEGAAELASRQEWAIGYTFAP